MNTLFVLVAAGAVGVIAYMLGMARRREVPAPKPFGLEAFENHGLGRASGDVLKAVAATISFLGHPFTVVDEANEEKMASLSQAGGARATIAKNIQAIRKLQDNNANLDFGAKTASARAAEMDALVAQVSSVVGKQ